MRAFLGVDLPRPQLPGGGASDHAPFHLTLRFFGDVVPARVAILADATRPVTAAQRPFRVRLNGLGAFPSVDRPRVVFVRITEGADELRALAAGLDRAFATVGLAPETRPFVPHATVLRVGSPRSRARAEELLSTYSDTEFSYSEVRDASLKESTLTPTGAVHRVIERFAFHGTTPTSSSTAPTR